MRYVALLRGINVGGNKVIRMTDLRESFEAMGFLDVATYIQSGNVILSPARPARAAALVKRIEGALGTIDAMNGVSRQVRPPRWST